MHTRNDIWALLSYLWGRLQLTLCVVCYITFFGGSVKTAKSEM